MKTVCYGRSSTDNRLYVFSGNFPFPENERALKEELLLMVIRTLPTPVDVGWLDLRDPGGLKPNQ